MKVSKRTGNTGIALIMHITCTHVSNMNRKIFINKATVTYKTIGVLLKERICSLWEQILFFTSSPYLGSDSRHIFKDCSWVCIQIILFWLHHWDILRSFSITLRKETIFLTLCLLSCSASSFIKGVNSKRGENTFLLL